MTSFWDKMKSGTILSVMMLLTQVVSFFIVNFLAQKIGLDGFGQFSILLQDFNWFVFLRDFGMTQVLIAWYLQSDHHLVSKHQGFKLTALMNIFSAGLLIIYIFTIRSQHPNQEEMLWLIPAILFNPGMYDWFFLSTKQWLKLFTIRLLQVSIYGLGTFYVMFQYDSIQIQDIIPILTSSFICSFIVGTLFFKPWKTQYGPIINVLKHIFHQSTPLALGGLLSFLYLPLGFFLIDWIHHGEEIVGIYNTSHRLIHIGSMLMVNFITSGIIHFNHQAKGISLKQSLSQALIFWLPAFLVCYFLGPQILELLFFGIDWQAADLDWAHMNLCILSFTFLFQGARNDYITWFISHQRTWTYLIFLTLGALINISLGYLLIQNSADYWMTAAIMAGDLFLSLSIITYFHWSISPKLND